MKSYYKNDMISYITNAFSDGLNRLNYVCNLKCYLYHKGSVCSNITGGWAASKGSSLNDNGNLTITKDGELLRTQAKINFQNYSKLAFNITKRWGGTDWIGFISNLSFTGDMSESNYIEHTAIYEQTPSPSLFTWTYKSKGTYYLALRSYYGGAAYFDTIHME